MAKNKLVLGKNTAYFNEYNPKILTPVDRSLGRAALGCRHFEGYDLWRLYELTFLDLSGRPQTAVGTISVPAVSQSIIESKSLKLYLGSFTMTRLTGLDELSAIITHDLNKKLKTEVTVQLCPTAEPFLPVSSPDFMLIDTENTATDTAYTYEYAPELLTAEDTATEEQICSHVLRTLCPVTGQPDHASVFIHYKGPKLSHQSLFAYLVSLRGHRGFHEQCCEMIFSDLMERIQPKMLWVCCCFTRRGGIDINPVRYTQKEDLEPPRTLRQ